MLLKCLWTENYFCLVWKFTFKNARFQSLNSLGLKFTILQAFKVVLFCLEKWYLNRAVKTPRDIDQWRHFVARNPSHDMTDNKIKETVRAVLHSFYLQPAKFLNCCRRYTTARAKMSLLLSLETDQTGERMASERIKNE